MTANPVLKKIIGIVVPLFILWAAYYGTFSPLRKSQIFIDTLRGINSAHSLSDFEKAMSVPLDYRSPVGQEELVRNTANMVLGIVQQNSDPKLIEEAVNYIENYYKPIIDRGHGMSFEQNLYILGAINEMAATKTSEVRYLEAAQKYYSKGLALGPKRPQFLFGLFDVYRMEGDVKNSIEIGQQIMNQWPTDTRTPAALDDFLARVRGATSSLQPPKQK